MHSFGMTYHDIPIKSHNDKGASFQKKAIYHLAIKHGVLEDPLFRHGPFVPGVAMRISWSGKTKGI